MPEPRLDDPWLFRSNVTDISELSRFDYPRVSSSPDDLHVQFAILGTINILVALASGLLILSILRSKTLRQKPFDLYLLFIAIPDFISGFSCMLTCLLSVKGKEYVGEAMCGYQSFYLNASVTANTWMNAVIIYEIHKLLRFSHVRRRYIPPTRKQVILQAAGVYCYACVWGVICAIQAFFPSHAYGGFYCIPMEEKGYSWFFYLIFLPGVFVLPSMYAVAVLAHIMWKGMLPQTGKRRTLAVFLMRIIFLYFLVFVPLAISILVGNFFYFESSWGYYVPAVMNHLQGILTTLLIYCTNKKISASMNKVLCCDCRPDDPRLRQSLSLQKSLQRLFNPNMTVTSEDGTPISSRMSSGLSGVSGNFSTELASENQMKPMLEDEDDDGLCVVEESATEMKRGKSVAFADQQQLEEQPIQEGGIASQNDEATGERPMSSARENDDMAQENHENNHGNDNTGPATDDPQDEPQDEEQIEMV
eukprot:CAMPEP_0172443848 /NCGR_PEP_ID=MMETSP1065-20121228/4037_1 /TAXON_ID=265537 /ORGANISM="Amphiprora paludosa, Strain CCMP125" /LENGTH=475 /DNA_ID=CAMNT_0013194207 /DNA_START=162 /DNA_END=1589 /DNA_ORIENTATION=-